MNNVITTYTTSKAASKIYLPNVTLSLERVIKIFNITTGLLVHEWGTKTGIASVSGADIMLNAQGLEAIASDTDKLQIIYDHENFPVAIRKDDTVGGPLLTSPALNIDLLTGNLNGWLDCQDHQSGAIQIQTGSGITAGGVTFECTNDILAGYVSVNAAGQTSAGIMTSYALAQNTVVQFVVPLNARYFRIRVSTAVAGGTVQASIVRSQQPANFVQILAQQQGAWTVQPGNTANTTPWLVTQLTPALSKVNSAATTNATSIKAAAGNVHSIVCSNSGAAAAYVKFFDLATAPAVGTSVPVFTITVPASGVIVVNGGANSLRFSTGIALSITAAAADADATAVAASQVKVMTNYS